MGKQQRAEEIAVGSGLVLVDKPAGWTSHDVVGRIRRLAGTRKVGHAGTLDPMATGVLVVGINRATRLLTHIVGVSKTYTATIRLGQSTTTDDAEGELRQTRFANAVTPERVQHEVDGLTGEIQQVPATVSAIKVDGRRAYDRARKGEDVQLAARPVTVHRFDVLQFRRVEGGRLVDVDVEVDVSSGTYVRALARDLGEALQVGGHLTALRRTAVGPYRIENALTLDQLAEDFGYVGLAEAAARIFAQRELSAEEAENLGHGRRITASGTGAAGEPDRLTAAFGPEGELIALLKDVPAKKDASASGEAARAAAAEQADFQAKPELVFAPQ
ncbi:tRNA pseudouridine(55) synthase TruB [Nesterenkonia xinjiangensis]|uniref:tRNA pseudouridine synthase B n=1 Tax=Nesterenkonia xinjiangensis TaxID=225327 RepID=A0A7Z0GN67_9MICC|nr:tRNA pseudouridine(55) synthase TruB [Nesterenkonia xinjiangensis]NYJ79097.1 tRNA pseudouridine55 synthase [Nesterenkonia xinjiangensis]